MGFGLGRRGLKTPKNVGLRVCPQGPRGTAQRDLKVKGRRTDLKGRHTAPPYTSNLDNSKLKKTEILCGEEVRKLEKLIKSAPPLKIHFALPLEVPGNKF